MKKILCFSLTILIFSLLCVSAFADEPGEHTDDYFWRNARKFDYSVSGDYIVNSPDGYATAWASPAALSFVENLPNGTEIYVQAVYKGWATAEYLADGRGVYANQWLPLELLTPAGSGADFAEQYADSIYAGSGYKDFFAACPAGEILCFYTYPGSGVVCGGAVITDGEPLELTALFTDGDGTRWGWVEQYSYRDVKGWVNLDEHDSSSLPRTRELETRLRAQPLSGDELSSAARLRYGYIITGAVRAGLAAAAAAVIAACALVFVSLRRKKSAKKVD